MNKVVQLKGTSFLDMHHSHSKAMAVDYEQLARAAISEELWSYVEGGAECENVLSRNRISLQNLTLLPRVLNDVSTLDLSANLLGHKLRLPVWLAPVGSVHRLHAESHLGVRQAAEAVGIGYSIGCALPESTQIEASLQAPSWFQLYVDGDVDWVIAQCLSAKARGFLGVILTVDVPVFPVRNRDVHTGNHASDRSTKGTSVWRKAFNWNSLAQVIAGLEGFPLILKGVQDPRDVQHACALGISAIWASNHGGRQWDQGPGMAQLIPVLRQSMPASTPLIVDGGFHCADEIIKGLALGADVVALGRAYLFPFIAQGQEGIQSYFKYLEQQMRIHMALLGCSRISALRSLQAGDVQDQRVSWV